MRSWPCSRRARRRPASASPPGEGEGTGVYLAIFGTVISTLIVPLPEEIALLGAGYLASESEVTLWGAYLASWAAIVIGDSTTYVVGRAFLTRILRMRLVQKIIPPELRSWAEGMVARHGVRAIALGRFLVALRGPVYLAIGGSGYPPIRFLLINSTVALVEVGLMVGAGYLFGTAHRISGAVQWIDLAVALVLVTSLLAPPLARHFLSRGAKRREA